MAIKNVKPYKLGDKLTPKQQKWIDEYIKCDDYTTASRNAGYTGTDTTLKNMGYQNSIKFKELLDARRLEISEQISNKNIAELEDIFEYWTRTFKDSSEDTRDRIKASELLAKAKGGFIEKKEVKIVDTDWFIEEDNNG